MWLANNRSLKKAYQQSPKNCVDIGTAVRHAVRAAHVEEMRLMATSRMQRHEAMEFTRPATRTPPTWPRGGCRQGPHADAHRDAHGDGRPRIPADILDSHVAIFLTNLARRTPADASDSDS